jgi:YD repeat-containing protein
VRIRYPDGSFEIFTYDAGTGAVTGLTRPYLDRYATTTLVRETRDLDADGVPDFITTRRREAGPSWLVELGFEIEWGGRKERSVLRASEASAAWNSPASVRVDERRFEHGPLRGEVQLRREADRTGFRRDAVLMADGSVRVMTERGALSADDRVTEGVRTVEIRSPRGVVTETRQEDIVTGLGLGLTKAESFDEWGRVLSLRRADGTVENRFFCETCGGLDAVEINGTTRRFTYDALGRKIEERVIVGGTELQRRRFFYDALDRLVRTVRVEAETGAEVMLGSVRYDQADRIVERYELGAAAESYTHALVAGGGTTVTVAYPGGGTRREQRSAAGEWTSIAGTAARPSERTWAPRPDGVAGYAVTLRWPNDDGSSRTEVHTVNLLGDEDAVVFSDGARMVRGFDAAGRVVRETDPDGVTLLRTYDALGQLSVLAWDSNRNGSIDYAGADRVIRLTRSVSQREGAVVWRRRAEVWPIAGRDEPVEIAVLDEATDGTRRWESQHGLTAVSQWVPLGGGNAVLTRTGPDGRVLELRTQGGRTLGWRERHPQIGDLAGADFDYDPAGRLRLVRDLRGRVTTYMYDGADRIVAIAEPDPNPQATGAGADPRITRYEYDSAGQVVTMTQPDGRVVNSSYWPDGLLRRRWGTGATPVEYAYDLQGRVASLTTWRDFAGDSGRATTVWRYSNERGFLVGKSFAEGAPGPTFDYSPAGRLTARRWARGVTTRYAYNTLGDLVGWDYSDVTPRVRLEFDRLGRLSAREDGSGRATYGFVRTTNAVASETLTSEGDIGVVLNRSFDEGLRPVRVGLGGLALGPDAVYGYDAASRLVGAAFDGTAVELEYAPLSREVVTRKFTAGGATQLQASRELDRLDRLRTLSYYSPGTLEVRWGYALSRDRFGRLLSVDREDGGRTDYTHDPAGRVNGETWSLRGGVQLPGRTRAWSFDDVGNLQWAVRNAQTSFFTPNALNQYTSRTVPGLIEVTGRADAAATVTVDVSPEESVPFPVERQADHFLRRLALDNTTSAVRSRLTVYGSRLADSVATSDALASLQRDVFLPQSPERFAYDADGNLIADGWWTYAWDGENRLVALESAAVRSQLGEPRQKLVFTYDASGRRVAKTRTEFMPAGFGRLLHARFADGSLTGPPLDASDRHAVPSADWLSANGTRDSAGARISGALLVPVEGDWTLALEGAGFRVFRLFLDGALVLDRTSDAVAPSVTRHLTAGAHDLKLEFVGLARMLDLRVTWSNGFPPVNVPAAAVSAWAPRVSQRRWFYDGWRPLAEYSCRRELLAGRLGSGREWQFRRGGRRGRSAAVGNSVRALRRRHRSPG